MTAIAKNVCGPQRKLKHKPKASNAVIRDKVAGRIGVISAVIKDGALFAWRRRSSHEGLVNHCAAAILATVPVSPQVTPRGVELSVSEAQAYTYGRARRVTRRVYRRSYRYARRAYRRGYYGAAPSYYGASSYYGAYSVTPPITVTGTGGTIEVARRHRQREVE